jgi:hypothetical protein
MEPSPMTCIGQLAFTRAEFSKAQHRPPCRSCPRKGSSYQQNDRQGASHHGAGAASGPRRRDSRLGVPTSFGPCCVNCADASCDERSSVAMIRTPRITTLHVRSAKPVLSSEPVAASVGDTPILDGRHGYRCSKPDEHPIHNCASEANANTVHDPKNPRRHWIEPIRS